MVDFSTLLSKKLDDVEAPVTLPAGSYLMTVSQYRTGESAQKKTPYVEFDLKINEALQVEDQEALEKVKNIHEKTLKTQFYLTEDSLSMLKDFCIKTGLSIEGKTFTELLSEIAGTQVVGIVTHRVDPNNSERVFAEVRNFVKA